MEATHTNAAATHTFTERERTLLGTALNNRLIELAERGSAVADEYEALIQKLGL